MARILAICYSQSGQLTRILKSLVQPLVNSNDIEIVWEELQPVRPYPFPWTFFKFLDVFPECVCMDPPEMKPFSFDPNTRFDLVILAYQVWYLSPSLPHAAFLKSPSAEVMKDTPVITVIGCRDMWLMGQEKVKKCIREVGGKLIDNVVFVKKKKKELTFITTPRWMFTGKKAGFWKIFPPAGVSEKDIMVASRYGEAILDAIERRQIGKGQSVLRGLGAVKVNPNNIRFERIAHYHFLIWAKFFRALGKQGQRRRFPFLFLFIVTLSCLVLLSLPLTMIFNIIINPLNKKSIAQEIAYYEQPSGSSTERLQPG